MSSKKMKDTKIPEATEQDSGFLSGPLDDFPSDSGGISGDSGAISGDLDAISGKLSEQKVPSVSVDNCNIDSGLVMLSEELSSCTLEPSHTVIPERCAPLPVDKRTPSKLPSLEVLFQQDDDGDTQLHIAAIHGSEKAVSTLIRVCPNKEWFNIPNDDGQTALHLAALSSNALVTRMLVIAGASIAVRDRRGETPLHKATILKNVECIKALVNPVKELPQRKLSTVLNQKNYNGQACVHLAASAGHVESLQALVYYGADINSRENLAGWTALHIAAQRGHLPAVAWLRERCSGADVRARDYAGRTPRRLAKRNPAVLRAFASLPDDSDSETESDEDMYDSDSESFFEMVSENLKQPLVA